MTTYLKFAIHWLDDDTFSTPFASAGAAQRAQARQSHRPAEVVKRETADGLWVKVPASLHRANAEAWLKEADAKEDPLTVLTMLMRANVAASLALLEAKEATPFVA
jgi:hypothetical protein